MTRLFAPIIRTLAFVRKEVMEVIRQPKLVATLIIGPFLTLLLLGLGYQSDMPVLRTLFVGDPDSELADELATAIDDLGAGNLEYAGLVEDRALAMSRLADGDVDMVVVLPDDPLTTVRNGERAVFDIAHRQLDPFEGATISLLARTTIDRVNRRLLEEVVAEGQLRSEDLIPVLDSAAESATALRSAVESGAAEDVALQQSELDEALVAAAEMGALMADLGVGLGGQDGSTFAAQIDDARQRIDSLPLGDDAHEARLQEAEELERTMVDLAALAGDLQRIDPAVLVSPFGVDAGVVGAVDIDLTDFYAPAVIALMLQHLAITFAALSVVRERTFGTTELFGVAPLRIGETLAGKYLGYAVIAGVVGGALSIIMLGVFAVPVVGGIGAYAGVLALTLAASLGIGFVISTLVTSDTQAVNIAMIMLLLSIFFSGFFIDLVRLAPEVQVVSRLLPITYAIEGLRSVMFTDAGVPEQTWAALGGGSIVLLVVAWAMMVWRLRST